jgi:hypothetical protein
MRIFAFVPNICWFSPLLLPESLMAIYSLLAHIIAIANVKWCPTAYFRIQELSPHCSVGYWPFLAGEAEELLVGLSGDYFQVLYYLRCYFY